MTTSGEDPRPAIDALFDRALDLPEAERAAFLAAASDIPAAVRSAVEKLLALAADDDPRLEPSLALSGPLWQSLSRELAPPANDDPSAVAGGRIGPWRLVRELGQGGMGTVYLAERVDGDFSQRVALKLLRAGVASERALARFAQERRILAGLEHPGIARLLDGGRTDAGRPYFAMELVEGLPIDVYSDDRRLTLRRRLELVLAVGRAVEHAHRNLVVHRDLKPSNIVVTESGAVKLLDFGIAKLLQPEREDFGLTQTSARVLTPSVASPEQVRGERISVASDVYQLGLLLYRLLTGRPAYELSASSAVEIEKTVCTAEPLKPSVRVLDASHRGGAPPDLARLADLRATTPGALAARLRGDLDCIVLKALRKEPERRYPTVGQLMADLERHLGGLPVEARPDTLGYRASRFVARHRAGVGALALAFSLLAAWALTATRQAAVIRQERDRAQAEATKAAQVRDFLVAIFASADPDEARGREVTARELLDRGWQRIESELAGQPEIRVELTTTVAEAYRELGLFDRARDLLAEGRAIGRGIDAPLDELLRVYGDVEREAGRYAEARALLDEALVEARRRHGSESPQVASVLSTLGRALYAEGEYPAARRHFENALAMRRTTLGSRHEDTAESLDDLALALQNLGDYAEAESLLTDALALRREILPVNHPDIASNLSDLALVVQNLGDAPRAAALYREALAAMIQVRGAEHPYVAIVMNNLARLLWTTGELDEAESLLRQALAIRRAALGPDHLYVALNLNDLGLTLQRQERLDDAETTLRQALAVYPPDHPWRAASVFNLGRVLEERGDLAGAESAYRQALDSQRRDYGMDHERVGIDLTRIGVVRQKRGDSAGADEALRAALEIFRAKLPEGHSRIAEALVPLAEVALAAGRRDEAEALAREAVEIRTAAFGADDDRTGQAARLLAASRGS